MAKILDDATVGTIRLGGLTVRRLGFGALLPIPGTSKVAHADENIDAAWVRLDEADVRRLDAATRG